VVQRNQRHALLQSNAAGTHRQRTNRRPCLLVRKDRPVRTEEEGRLTTYAARPRVLVPAVWALCLRALDP